MVVQRRCGLYNVIRKRLIGDLDTRETYDGLLIVTKETSRSYTRWSISASSYVEVIHKIREGKEHACLISKEYLKVFDHPLPEGQLVCYRWRIL